MSRLSLFGALTVALLIVSSAISADAQTPQPPGGTRPADLYIVQFRDEAVTNVDAVVAELYSSIGFESSLTYRHAIKGFAAFLDPDQLDALGKDPRVLAVEKNQTYQTADQSVGTGLRRAGGKLSGPARIDGTSSGSFSAFEVAVLDTGVDVDHPELTVPGGVRHLNANQSCNDGNSSFDDDGGHGTSVAGVIAAKDNTSAYVGVAPGARTWAVKVLDSGGFGDLACVIQGVDWVTGKKLAYILGQPGGINFRVANMSLAGPSSSILCNSVNQSVAQGIVYAVAAGNQHQNASNYSPANCDRVITVSAIADYNGLPASYGQAPPTCNNFGPDDTLASFSNFGTAVEIAAPGTCVGTTAMGGGTRTDFGGTSAASPHVAGAAVLFLWNGYSGSTYGIPFVNAMVGQGWTVPWGNPCSFTQDADNSHEPLLWLAPGCATLTKTFSDVDCSGTINSTDANKVTSWVLTQPTAQTEPCPDIGPSIKINGTPRLWGDVDCNGVINTLDSQKILQYVGGGNPSQNRAARRSDRRSR